MGFGLCIEVKGNYALFTRSELKVERYSYDVITPSAARGIIEAIYWKPAIRYVIDRIHVMEEPRFTNIRRNEVSKKVSAKEMNSLMCGKGGTPYLNSRDAIQQRASTVLRDVRYLVEFHFEMTDKAGESDTPEKHYNILLRRLRNGQNFHQPCLGVREFPAEVRLLENCKLPESPLKGSKDLGIMLYDMDFSNPEDITPVYFRAEMNDGVIDLKNVELLR